MSAWMHLLRHSWLPHSIPKLVKIFFPLFESKRGVARLKITKFLFRGFASTVLYGLLNVKCLFSHVKVAV